MIDWVIFVGIAIVAVLGGSAVYMTLTKKTALLKYVLGALAGAALFLIFTILKNVSGDKKVQQAEQDIGTSQANDAGRKTNKAKTHLQNTFKCECSDDNLYITNNGDLYPCVEMFYSSKDYCLGNLTADEPERLFKTNKKFHKQIKKEDVCAYSYISSEGFSACLNRGKCPKSLMVYMRNAKE